jgi:hypothetical protein
MNARRLAEYGGCLLPDGVLQMRDPHDNARHRYQYARIRGVPSRRTLPASGDYDPPARWEPLDLTRLLACAGTYHPILDYFGHDQTFTPRRRRSR